MCEQCGTIGSHAISLSERPAQRLAGLFWEGSHSEAAAGAIRPLLAEMQSVSLRRPGLWKSPLVGVSWNVRSDGFRHFVAIAIDPSEAAPDGTQTLDLPEMTFASSWHGPHDGNVAEHYLRMIEWISDMGWSRDFSHLHQREEYPADLDLGSTPSLRLLLPVATG